MKSWLSEAKPRLPEPSFRELREPDRPAGSAERPEIPGGARQVHQKQSTSAAQSSTRNPQLKDVSQAAETHALLNEA